MEAALTTANIKIGFAEKGHVGVTPAVLIYCNKLVDHLSRLPMEELLSSVTLYSRDLIQSLNDATTDVHALLVQSATTAIQYELEGAVESGSDNNILGMGRVVGALGMMFNMQTLTFVASDVLIYGIYDCKLSNVPYGRDGIYPQATTERLRLPAPVSNDLIDGMLVSEAVALSTTATINHCVCVEGVPLWPSYDAGITMAPDDSAYEGSFRARASGVLTGAFALDEPDLALGSQGYLYFSNSTFIQGIQSMDKILNARQPSYRDLEIYHNGWVPAVTL